MAVEDAHFLVLLAGHVVQALVGLHVADLSATTDTVGKKNNTLLHVLSAAGLTFPESP